jgi:NAD+ diphosphatase
VDVLAGSAPSLVFMGVLDEVAHFALDISHIEKPQEHEILGEVGQFVDLRNAGALLDRVTGSLLAYARGLMYWHARHLYCGVCGHATESQDAGHVRVCSNPACKAQHFPRTDPAVIMLVTCGERCLLGRQKTFLPGMHSTLAGFVEPGESLEEAVAREVFEETGVRVHDVRYHSSQPWPFPGSIMLGFHAEARDTKLDINFEELETARWFTREELFRIPENETFRLPRKVSIARQLVEHWMRGG